MDERLDEGMDEPMQESTQFLETLDESLDEGVVAEGQVVVYLPLVGLEVMSVETCTFVASFETYLEYAHALEREQVTDESDALPPDELPQRSARLPPAPAICSPAPHS